MFLPLHDRNALRFIPFQVVTVGLIAVNVVVFVWQQSLSGDAAITTVFSGGLTPATLFGNAPVPPIYDVLPQPLTLVTHMFLHGSWLHLISNMVFLWVFGDNVEDAMGHLRFLVFYLACGIAAGLAHAVMQPDSVAPLVGASGATSGIVGAYLLLFPRIQVWVLILFRLPWRLPAYGLLIAWLAFQVYFAVWGPPSSSAWWAHIGGFFAGLVLVPLFKRRDVPLFRAEESPRFDTV